jgi:DNA-binding protein
VKLASPRGRGLTINTSSTSPNTPRNINNKKALNNYCVSSRVGAGSTTSGSSSPVSPSRFAFESFSRIDSMSSLSTPKPIKAKKPQKYPYEKYHKVLSTLHKQYDGLYLDFGARLRVISDLRELDCLSDDEDTANHPQTDPNDLQNNMDFARESTKSRPMSSTIERRLQIRSLDNYIHRKEDIRERAPTAAEEVGLINRNQARERNINRAVDIMVRRRQAKDEQINKIMIAFLKEAASAENQQIRRFTIGFVSRVINKAKSDYIIRSQLRVERREARNVRRLKAKEVISRNWRIARFNVFVRGISKLVQAERDRDFQETLSDDKAFKDRVYEKHLAELADVREYQSRQLGFRRHMLRSAVASSESARPTKLLQSKEEAVFERTRPDLEPFSGMVSGELGTVLCCH